MGGVSTALKTGAGVLQLLRYPARPRESLRAWCAADHLLIEEVLGQGEATGQRLTANDDFGALTLALAPVATWTDSSLAATALRNNETRNQRKPTPVIWSTDPPPAGIELVAMRVPKNLPYFQHQLACLAQALPPGALVIAGGMDKHLSPRTAELMDKWLGPTTRHRGKHKARLFSSRVQKNPPPAEDFGSSYYCEQLDVRLYGMANVFSAGQLDIGTRFLLSQLAAIPAGDTAIDLACGNGVLGLAAFRAGLARQVAFCDESAMSIASVRRNAAGLAPGPRTPFSFHLGDGLAACPDIRADLILCNPPFHLGHTVDDFAGRRILSQCAEHLEPGGRLCLVANRHLKYQGVLKRQFRQVNLLASNSKFNIYLARR